VFFYGAAYQKSQSAVFLLPKKGVPSAVVGTIGDVRDWKGGAVKLGVEYEAKVSSRVNGVE